MVIVDGQQAFALLFSMARFTEAGMWPCGRVVTPTTIIPNKDNPNPKNHDRDPNPARSLDRHLLRPSPSDGRECITSNFGHFPKSWRRGVDVAIKPPTFENYLDKRYGGWGLLNYLHKPYKEMVSYVWNNSDTDINHFFPTKYISFHDSMMTDRPCSYYVCCYEWTLQ